MRKTGGKLQNADFFIENYFKSGITTTFEYLSSLNYRVKYLYKGEVFDSNDNVTIQSLANASAFNGSRRVKVKNWLTKRLRYMDFMLNVIGLKTPITEGNDYTVPVPELNYRADLESNNDITILHSAFDTNNKNVALNSFQGEVEIYTPTYTPFIFASGSSRADEYLLPGGINTPNRLSFYINAKVGTRFYGSGQFTSVNKVEYMFTDYYSIVSDNLEKITYGGSNVAEYKDGLLIDAKSVMEINLNIPKMGGYLNISEKCISLLKINIANSGFYGDFDTFPNLQEVDISGVNVEGVINIGNSNFLTGERINISGSDREHKTTLNKLNIFGVKGNFNCVNTNIEDIVIENNSTRDSEFSIIDDSKLKKLRLVGFRKVSIIGCNNLETLSIDDALEEIYIVPCCSPCQT